MSKHVWQCHGFEPDGVLDGVRGCIQTYKCRGCAVVISLPLNVEPGAEGCTGAEYVPKPRVQERRLKP